MKKIIKRIKLTFKRLGAPLVLALGLLLGFVADRVGTFFLAGTPKHSSHHTVKANPPAPATSCPQIAEHRASPLKKVAQKKHEARHASLHKGKHVAKAHHKHGKKQKLAAAKKHKGKKSLRVADSK